MKAAIRSRRAAREYYIEERCHIRELSNVPDDPACSIARARVAPGVTTRWHRLAGVAERYVILAGRGRAEVGGRPPRAVAPGDVVRIPPDCRQRIANVGLDDLVFLAVCTPRFQPEHYVGLREPDAGAKPARAGAGVSSRPPQRVRRPQTRRTS